MKRAKQPKKKKTLRGFLAKVFLIFAILFFLLAAAGVTDGVISVFVFCLLCGLACLYVRRLLKKDAAESEVAATATKENEQSASSVVSSFKILDDELVEIVFPDGHSEQHRACEKVDNACLITENSRTYHNKVGCFKKWSDEYRDTFTNWQIISHEDAEKRGLRRCSFCYAYELIKEDSNSFVEKLYCSAQKHQENLRWCKVGEKCTIEYDAEKERYTVLDGGGDEIGYLPTKLAEDRDIMLEGARAFIDEIIEQDDGKYKVRLVIRGFKVW